jgi:prephenate dehydrogenase
MSKPEIGIIGFGQMAQFMAKFLTPNFEVFASDRADRSDAARRLGARFVPLATAAGRDIVMLAVPIGKVRDCLNEIRVFLKQNVLLMDVCSVKANPVNAMLELAPAGAEIVGTHPLFGPQSGKNGIAGLKIVVCPARTTKLESIRRFLEALKLEVIVCSPEEHDRAMAETQALEHFIGRALINLDAKEGRITTPTFRNLIALKDAFREDSIELFNSIQNDNPFAKEVRMKFLDELKLIEGRLQK